MPCNRMLILFGFCLLAVIGGRLEAQLQRVSHKGRIVSFSPDGWIGVQLEDGKVILAGVNKVRKEDNVTMTGIPEPQIEVSAEETIKGLAPGMFVRFNAKVINEKKIVDPIEEVTVFDRTENSVFGLLPNNIGPQPEEGAKVEPATADAQDMLVSGQLTAVRGTSMTVAFPDRKMIRAKLARDAKVHIRGSDPRLARMGDAIEVTGLLVKPGKLFAVEVKITRAEAEDKKPLPRAARNPRAPGEKKADSADKKGDLNPNQSDPEKADADKPAAEAKPDVYVGKILKIN